MLTPTLTTKVSGASQQPAADVAALLALLPEPQRGDVLAVLDVTEGARLELVGGVPVVYAPSAVVTFEYTDNAFGLTQALDSLGEEPATQKAEAA